MTGDIRGPRQEYYVRSAEEWIVLHRYHLLNVLGEAAGYGARTGITDVLAWIGVLLAFLLALLPRDFQDFLGLSAATWDAVAFAGVAVSGIMLIRTIYALIRARFRQGKIGPFEITAGPQSPSQIIDGMLAEMRAEKSAFTQMREEAVAEGREEVQQEIQAALRRHDVREDPD